MKSTWWFCRCFANNSLIFWCYFRRKIWEMNMVGSKSMETCLDQPRIPCCSRLSWDRGIISPVCRSASSFLPSWETCIQSKLYQSLNLGRSFHALHLLLILWHLDGNAAKCTQTQFFIFFPECTRIFWTMYRSQVFALRVNIVWYQQWTLIKSHWHLHWAKWTIAINIICPWSYKMKVSDIMSSYYLWFYMTFY